MRPPQRPHSKRERGGTRDGPRVRASEARVMCPAADSDSLAASVLPLWEITDPTSPLLISLLSACCCFSRVPLPSALHSSPFFLRNRCTSVSLSTAQGRGGQSFSCSSTIPPSWICGMAFWSPHRAKVKC